jgi:hypothetical protein
MSWRFWPVVEWGEKLSASVAGSQLGERRQGRFVGQMADDVAGQGEAVSPVCDGASP